MSEKSAIEQIGGLYLQKKEKVDEAWDRIFDFLSAYNTALNAISEKFVVLDKIVSVCEEQVGI